MVSDNTGRYSDDYTVFEKAATNLLTITFISKVQIIAGYSDFDYAFDSCKTIEHVYFEAGSQLKEIQKYAFSSCAVLQTIDFSNCNHLTTIGEYAFYLCQSLTSLNLPSSVSSIGTWAFSQCKKINSFQVPKSMKSLLGYTFNHCDSLETVTFEDGSLLTSINSPVFDFCIALKILHLPPLLTEFNPIAVWNVPTLENIILDQPEKNLYFSAIDGVLFNSNKTSLIYYPSSYSKTLNFPSTCVTINQYAFTCLQKTTFEIPSKIISIGLCAFRRSNLVSIVIPSTVTTLSSGIFRESYRLSKCDIKCDMTVLPSYTFYQCGFTSYDVPDGVTVIEELCFYGCSNLQNVTLPSSLTDVKSAAFSGCHNNFKLSFKENASLVIDSQLLILSQSNTTLTNYLANVNNDNITIPKTVKTIARYAFSQKTNIYSIIIEDGSDLTTIEPYAFYRCTNLFYIWFIPKLTGIGESAFHGCSSLKNFSVGSEIKQIMKNAFADCISLQEFVMKNDCNNLTIGEGAFIRCKALETVDFKSGLSSIESEAFSESGIHSIAFPATFSTIGENVFNSSSLETVTFIIDETSNQKSQFSIIRSSSFRNSYSLSSFQFTDSVTQIERYAFEATSLTNVTLPKTVQFLGEGCFKSCKNLINFTIPPQSELETIEYGIFEDSSSFQTIISDESNNFIVENTCLFNKNRTELVILPPASKIAFLYFPQTVKVIRQKAIYGCKNLIAVIIPDNSIQRIEPYAFKNSVNIDRINLPLSVEEVGAAAFENCHNLKCGILVSSNNQTFIDSLYSVAKLRKTALLSCQQFYTCGGDFQTMFIPRSTVFILLTFTYHS